MNIFKWLWPAKPKYTHQLLWEEDGVAKSKPININPSNEMEVEKLAHDINRTFDHLRDIQPIEIDQMERDVVLKTARVDEFHEHPDTLVLKTIIIALESKLRILQDYNYRDSHLDAIEQEIWDRTVRECEALTYYLEIEHEKEA